MCLYVFMCHIYTYRHTYTHIYYRLRVRCEYSTILNICKLFHTHIPFYICKFLHTHIPFYICKFLHTHIPFCARGYFMPTHHTTYIHTYIHTYVTGTTCYSAICALCAPFIVFNRRLAYEEPWRCPRVFHGVPLWRVPRQRRRS